MKFVYPFYLYLLAVLVPLFIVVAIKIYKKYKRIITVFINLKLLNHICSVPQILKVYKVQLLISIFILAIFLFSLSSPQWGIVPQEVKTHGVDVIIGIDTSKSMLAEDITPNRLEFTKKIINVLLDRLQGNRVGIITFAGIAFYQCPLTLDIDAAKYLLSVIDTDIVPYPGTKIGDCIAETIRVLKDQPHKGGKILIIFTDGEDHDSSPVQLAQEARKNGIVIYTVGVGTPEGRPIPIRDNAGNIVDYKKDKSGNIVTSKLNEELLTQIANITNGRYYSLTYGELGIVEQLYDEIANTQKVELKSKIYNLYKNRYHYFVYILIFLFLIEIFVPPKWFAEI